MNAHVGSIDTVILDNELLDPAYALDLLEASSTLEVTVTEAVFTLELLHFTDQEANSSSIGNIAPLSGVLNALREEDLGGDGVADNTLVLSSGDAFIPGVFFDASEEVFGSGGIADIQIQNELGVEAVALGNHEFDFGTGVLADLIDGSATGDFSSLTGSTLEGLDFTGAAFPYLSTNLDFSADANLAPLEVAGGQAPQGNVVTSSVVIDVNGEAIGVVGATTPTLAAISSPGTVGISPAPFGTPPSAAELDALAAEIQLEVDALLAANEDMDKVILLAHMQQITVEFGLATRLRDVDIIVAGGSNTRLFDEDDRIRDGDSDQGDYPTFFTNAGGTTTAVVNTDGSYKYVGRLVIDFDADGNVIAESYDASVSGAYATDAEGLADLNAEALIDPEIQAIVDAIQAQIIATESNVFGVADVFLNGNRSGVGTADDPDGVRTQETNLGNLTADANLAYAEELLESDIQISLKNGGGIRASIGQDIVPPGGTESVRTPNEAILDGDGNIIKPEGGISQTDIASTLAFNNNLVVLTLTRSEIVALLEHGVSALPGAAGQFPQLAGVKLSFDSSLPAGDRILSAAIVDDDGTVLAELVRNGELAGDPDQTFDVVTLGFLAASRFDDDGNFTGGGDGYPFPNLNTDAARGEVGDPAVIARVNLRALDDGTFAEADSVADFADTGTEQDALAEFLDDTFNPETGGVAFAAAETGPGGDTRIQNLAFRSDAVFFEPAPVATGELGEIAVAVTFDSLVGEDGAEVVAHEAGRLYVTNGEVGAIDVWDIATETKIASVDLTYLPGYGGVQSVAVKNGLIAAAVGTPNVERMTPRGETIEVGRNGYVVLIDAETLQVIDRVTVGNLPDMVTFTPDGTKILVANEGEFNAENGPDRDPAGSVSIIDVSDLVDPSATRATFRGLTDDQVDDGVRLMPRSNLAAGLEPEYIAVSPDGTTAFVTLQEANAIGVLDLETGSFERIIDLGTVDHSKPGFELDPEDDGQIGIRTFENLVGLRMPDAIAAFETGGATYLITANEGDGRGDATDFPRDRRADEARVEDILAGDVEVLYNGRWETLAIDPSVDTTGLERLTVSIIDGDTDGDGDIDVLHAFGSRSFTIFDTDGNVVFDSGSEFERILADLLPEIFNNDDGEVIGVDEDGDGEPDEVDNRSDAKGPEPEAVAVGEIGDQTYAFIGLERASGVVVYNVTDPVNAYFVDYIDGFATGDVGPETIVFIPASESASGVAQIAVANEISGTTVVYDLGALPSADDLVLDETFDDADGFAILAGGTGSRPQSFFSDGQGDYFGITDGAGGGDFGGDPPPVLPTYLAGEGAFLVAQDLDGEGGPNTIELVWSGIDISGLSSIGFSVDLAEALARDGVNDIDNADFIRFDVSIDDGARQNILTFVGNQEFNGLFRQDTDLDGLGDGIALGETFQTIFAKIAHTGSTLDLYLTARVEAGDEDFALDNVRIFDGGEMPGGIDLTPIYEIQGAGHVSPFVLGTGQTTADFFANLPADTFSVTGEAVTTQGVVTAVDTNGFYLQDPNGDGDSATSDALFVFTSGAPGVVVGQSVEVAGTVAEFFPGDTDTRNLPLTQLVSPTVNVIADLGPVTAEEIGGAGRTPPTMGIDDDAFTSFEPDLDGIDFFESLEAMLVTVVDPLAVAGTNQFGEIFTVADDGAGATGLSARGTLNIAPDDFNPEKIQIDADSGVLPGFEVPEVAVGARLSDVTGVVSYDFGNFQVVPTTPFTVESGPALEPEVTAIEGNGSVLTIASYNVLNLDPVVETGVDPDDIDDDVGDGRFAAIAEQIVANLNAPDIIGLQEIQDESGAQDDGVVSAAGTLEALVDAIADAGGPTYAFVDNTFIADGAGGGQPGGNIRTAFLYREDRVTLDPASVQTIGGQGAGEAFEGSRLPLVADFAFAGQTVTVVNNHWSSKGGSAPILGIEQDFAARQEDPSVNGSLDEREAQSAAVQAFLGGLLASDPDAKVVVLGDLNEFEFVSPVTDLEAALNVDGDGINNLTNTLPETERYTFNFQGNSQSLDHILVSDGLEDVATFDIVHVNSEFAATDARASDHDPLLVGLELNAPPVAVADAFGGSRGEVIEGNLIDGSGSGGVADSDPNGNVLDVVAETIETENGSAVVKADGTFTYTPDTAFIGEDSFTYTVTDGELTATAAVTVTVAPADGDIVGDDAPNALFGSRQDDAIFGLAGDDDLRGRLGEDLLVGGEGDDDIRGGLGDDEMIGGIGEDAMNGGLGDDLMHGGEGDDVLRGGVGDDIMDGGEGDDVLLGGPGSNVYVFDFSAAIGDDVVRFDASRDTIRFLNAEFDLADVEYSVDRNVAVLEFGEDVGSITLLGRPRDLDAFDPATDIEVVDELAFA